MESYSASELPVIGNDVVRWLAQLIKKLVHAEQTEERHKVLNEIAQRAYVLPVELLWFVSVRCLHDGDHLIRGDMCYVLGLSKKPSFVPLIEPLTGDAHHWVCGQAQDALQTLASGSSAGGDEADIRVLTEASIEAKLYYLDCVASRVSRFPGPLLGALITFVLSDSDPEVLARACRLAARWGAINRQGATQLIPLIQQLIVRDRTRKVQVQARIALHELDGIEESRIELDLVTAENTVQAPKVHLPALRKKKRIVELQISSLEWRIQDARSNGDRLRLSDERARKQSYLDELEKTIQEILDPFAQDRPSI
jgi:hypothetical protein